MRILLMYPPSEAHLSRLREATRNRGVFSIARDEAEARELAGETEVILGNRYFLQSLPRAKRLRWMQSNSVGVDLILQAEALLRERKITLTCAKGVYDDEMADHALALLLALVRQIHRIRDDRGEKKWLRRRLPYLSGARVMVLGWGGVGRAIGTRLQAFGARVTGVRRHGGPPSEGRSDGFSLCGPDRWRARLPETDILVMALPLTADTFRLVGRSELSRLPRHARVVNVGRGETLDQEALLEQLREGALEGAALDVLLSEPPGEDDPVWKEPRLLVTPHVARSKETPPYRWEPLFVENLGRYAAGEALRNIVDYDKGY